MRAEKTSRRRVLAAPLVLALTVVLEVGVAAPAAFAAKLDHGGGGSRGGGGGGTSTTTGNDVSWPQCGGSLPSSEAFGVVGVNGGLANDLNPCLGPSSAYPSYSQSELYWAVATATATSTSPQPKASLYLNTADPGNLYNGQPITDWPTSGGNTTYGTCTTTTVTTSSGTATVGQNSPACAWQYGYDKAHQDITWLTEEADAINGQETKVTVSDAPANYPWWLDVETGNTWQSGTSGQEMNVAELQGMVTALQDASVADVGVYSTSSQWSTITGGTASSPAGGSLLAIPDWIPGARTLSGAQSNCKLASFTDGPVLLTQWTSSGLDSDYACKAW